MTLKEILQLCVEFFHKNRIPSSSSLCMYVALTLTHKHIINVYVRSFCGQLQYTARNHLGMRSFSKFRHRPHSIFHINLLLSEDILVFSISRPTLLEIMFPRLKARQSWITCYPYFKQLHVTSCHLVSITYCSKIE